MQTEQKVYDNAGDLIGALLSAGLMAKAKSMMVPKEKQADMVKAALLPFLNLQNIALILSEKNIAKVCTGIIAALPKLDKHYIFHCEPTADNKDVFYQVSYRPDGGTDPLALPVISGYLSQVNQQQIFTLILKFFPNGNTNTTGEQKALN